MERKPRRIRTKSSLPRPCSTQEIAEQFDVHEQTVREWASQGCPHDPSAGPRKSMLFEPAEVAAWLQSQNRSGKVGRPRLNDNADLNETKLAKEREMAENWRLRNEQLRGELVNKSEYRQHWIKEVQTIKGKFRGMGVSVAPQCVGMDSPEIQRIVDSRIEQVFRELSE